LAGIQGAFKDGMDVINLSLGDSNGWEDTPLNLVVNKLAKLGTIIVAAAGNSGDLGVFTLGSPAGASEVFSVASVDNTFGFQDGIIVNEIPKKLIPFFKSQGANNTSWKFSGNLVTAEAKGANATGCSAAEKYKHVKGKVAFVTRGDCDDQVKALNLQKAGAKAVMIGGIFFDEILLEATIKIPVVGLNTENGDLILKKLKESKKGLTVNYDERFYVVDIPTGKTISDFSSQGLGNNMQFKPDISAPGGEIFSSVPRDQGSFATYSGTSMACPYTVGAVALLLESDAKAGKVFAKGERHVWAAARLQNSATYLNNALSGSKTKFLDTPIRQGAGLVNVERAIAAKQVVLPSKLQFRYFDDTPSSPFKNLSITIVNNSPKEAAFTFSNIPTMYVKGVDSFTPIYKAPGKSGVAVEVSPSFVTVPANGKIEVTVKVSFTKEFESEFKDSDYWLIGGFVQLKPAKGEASLLSVPYAFTKGNHSEFGQKPPPRSNAQGFSATPLNFY
jgi:minor extracellular serine protease Vpr